MALYYIIIKMYNTVNIIQSEAENLDGFQNEITQ